MPESEFHTDLTVGEILRRCRVKYNISFEQAERDLRIKAEHLEALEHNSIERLPGRVYVFGFVRTYSEYLGLDGDKMVGLLKKQAGRKVEKVVKPALRWAVEDEEEERAPGLPVIGGSAVALIAALILIASLAPQTPREIPPVPKQLADQMKVPEKPPEESVAEEVAGVVAAPAEEAAPEAAHPIVLKALQGTWLEIRDSKKQVVFSRVLNPGEEYWVPEDKTDLYMTLGNAGGLQIVLNGDQIPLLGALGQVKRNVPLTVEALQGKNTKPKTP